MSTKDKKTGHNVTEVVSDDDEGQENGPNLTETDRSDRKCDQKE